MTGYRVYRGGGADRRRRTGTSYTDTGLTNGTAYSYKVAAVDAAGNVSAADGSRDRPRRRDTTAPTRAVRADGDAG